MTTITTSYLCTLRDKKGFIEERFYREGESETDVLSSLELFCWPEGTWTVKDPQDISKRLVGVKTEEEEEFEILSKIRYSKP